jgi:hypothetical protein
MKQSGNEAFGWELYAPLSRNHLKLKSGH